MTPRTTCELDTRHRERLFEDALGASPSPELRQHLEGCAPCRAEIENLRQTISTLDSREFLAPLPPQDPFLVPRTIALHDRRARKKDALVFRVAVLGGALAGGLVLSLWSPDLSNPSASPANQVPLAQLDSKAVESVLGEMDSSAQGLFGGSLDPEQVQTLAEMNQEEVVALAGALLALDEASGNADGTLDVLIDETGFNDSEMTGTSLDAQDWREINL